MATRLEEILIRARDTLSDPNAERWTDARLLRLADEAQKTIASFTGLLKKKVEVPMVVSQVDYSLPADAQAITRVANEFNQAVQLVTYEHADNYFGFNWEQHVGGPVKAVIFDKLGGKQFKVYPKPVDNAVQQVGTPPNQLYGILVSGEVTGSGVSSPFGVATGFEALATTFLTVNYLANPVPLVTALDALQFNESYDKAMKFYVTGMALRDDKDTQNRQIGNEELTLFTAELRRAINDSALDDTAAGTNYAVGYSRGI